jgi:hypothetical protein
MAGYYRRNKPQKSQGKGVLNQVTSEGPYIEWVGKPEYYRHTLDIDGEQYRYESDSTDLGVELGETVVFRFTENKDGKVIDRRSLGRWIDPASLMS